ncbi:hypothetical protein QQS21_009989, partial [Conoideocrella luteorostrata]
MESPPTPPPTPPGSVVSDRGEEETELIVRGIKGWPFLFNEHNTPFSWDLAIKDTLNNSSLMELIAKTPIRTVLDAHSWDRRWAIDIAETYPNATVVAN